jgi:hypothetical protein
MGLVMGSIFFGLNANEINNKFGVLFFALLYLGLGGMAQLPAAIESRNVFYKQHAQVHSYTQYTLYTLYSMYTHYMLVSYLIVVYTLQVSIILLCSTMVWLLYCY